MADETPTQTKKKIGKRSRPKHAPLNKGAIQLYVHEIRDKAVGNLLLKNSANAWWLDVGKVEKLIDALKLQCTITEAMIYAGITRHQYYYFLELHPEFSDIKEACEKVLVLKARQNVAKRIENDANASYVFLQDYDRKQEKKQAEEKPVKPNAVVFVDFGEPLPEELQALEDQDFAPDVTEEDNHA